MPSPPQAAPLPSARTHHVARRRIALVLCFAAAILAAALVPLSWLAIGDITRTSTTAAAIGWTRLQIRSGAINFSRSIQPAPWSIAANLREAMHEVAPAISWNANIERDRGQYPLHPSMRPGRLFPGFTRTSGGFRVTLPAWNLAAAFAGAAWLLARRHRRLSRIENHQCLACGYSLTGIAPAAPCPECGRPQALASPTPPAPTSAPPIQ